MSIELPTAEITHTNIDPDTREKTKLITSYQLTDDSEIILVQSWTTSYKPYPLYKISKVDLAYAIRQQKGLI